MTGIASRSSAPKTAVITYGLPLQTVMVRHWSADQIGSPSHWTADQIGSLSWFEVTHIKETAGPIGLGIVPSSNAGAAPDQGNVRQRGSWSGQDKGTLLVREAALTWIYPSPSCRKKSNAS
jgi:hypothetical protein